MRLVNVPPLDCEPVEVVCSEVVLQVGLVLVRLTTNQVSSASAPWTLPDRVAALVVTFAAASVRTDPLPSYRTLVEPTFGTEYPPPRS